MAIETKRGCGFRKVGGLYLCGGGLSVACDRLPFPIEYCPTCGAGIKFTQGFTWIDWMKFAGNHEGCKDKHLMCYLCIPNIHPQPYGLLWVGESFYTPQSFIREALEMGVSKRIPFIPKGLKLGETVVLLAHKKVIRRELEPDGSIEDVPGVFYAFIPAVIEMLIYESELTEEKREELVKRGISPIMVPDNDIDHSDEKTTIALDPTTKRFSKVLLEE